LVNDVDTLHVKRMDLSELYEYRYRDVYYGKMCNNKQQSAFSNRKKKYGRNRETKKREDLMVEVMMEYILFNDFYSRLFIF
jgi:hypothetical protein